MKNSPRNHEPDRRSNEWLDADVDDGDSLPQDEQAQARAADLQLVDALLSSMSSHAADEREDRIRRVMKAIDDNQRSPNVRRRFLRWQSVVAIAATLMVALSLLWPQFAQDTRANEVLREISEVAMESIDRVYHLRRDVSSSKAVLQLEGELYLRGRDGFVLRCGNVVLGRNGDEYWLVAPEGDVLVADNFEWMVAESERGKLELELLKELSVDSRKVPLMQLSSVIELMQRDYELTLRSDVRHHDRRVEKLVGTLRDTASKLPDTIRLWSDTDSRIIHRAELSWGGDNTLILELASAMQIPTDWYDHEAHHTGEQPVRRVPRGG